MATPMGPFQGNKKEDTAANTPLPFHPPPLLPGSEMALSDPSSHSLGSRELPDTHYLLGLLLETKIPLRSMRMY